MDIIRIDAGNPTQLVEPDSLAGLGNTVVFQRKTMVLAGIFLHQFFQDPDAHIIT